MRVKIQSRSEMPKIRWMKPHDTTKNNLKILHLSLKKSANVRKYKNDNLCEKDWVNSQLTVKLGLTLSYRIEVWSGKDNSDQDAQTL